MASCFRQIYLAIFIAYLITTNGYKLSPILVVFDDAILYCKSTYNSSLATIYTPTENSIVSQLCSSDTSGNCWIGSHKTTIDYWTEDNEQNNDKNCVEIVPNIHTIYRNEIKLYKGEFHTISCHELRSPICNDPPIIRKEPGLYRPRRKLLTTTDPTADPTTEPTMNPTTDSCASTDSNTCYIATYNAPNTYIICDATLPNCVIEIDSFTTYSSTIRCPTTNNCLTCSILCVLGSCVDLIIEGNDCQLLEILVDDYAGTIFKNNTFYAPGNGGSLEMVGRMIDTQVISQPGTHNILITLDEGLRNEIDARYITGDLRLNCTGTGFQACAFSSVICGANMSSHCNVTCSARSGGGDGTCEELTVFTFADSNVNWVCAEDENSCVRSRLACDDISNPTYSLFKYDGVINGWYYTTGDCIPDWEPPAIPCTFENDDTCYLVRQYMEYSKTIQCLDSKPNCQVQLGIVEAKEIWPKHLESIVRCPNATCVSCLVICNVDDACDGIAVYGEHCETVQVTVRASEQFNVTMHAPDGGGNLILLSINDGNASVARFRNFDIISYPGTGDITVNITGIGTHNFINGTHAVGSVDLNCNSAECYFNEVICPMDLSGNWTGCNIDCRHGQCGGTSVKAVEGTHDVKWRCDWDCDEEDCNDNFNASNWEPDSDFAVGEDSFEYSFIDDYFDSCTATRLYCLEDYSASSDWYFNFTVDAWQWVNPINNGCIALETMKPTMAPTNVTNAPSQPTDSPSSDPTTAPTEAPTAAPTEAEFEWGEESTMIVGGSAGAVLLVIVVFIYCCYYYKRRQNSVYVQNALVLLVGFNKYDTFDRVKHKEIDRELQDLAGVNENLETMLGLFQKTLNYDVYTMDATENDAKPWTEKNVKKFFTKKAKHLAENTRNPQDGTIGKGYDGLIVFVTCHGTQEYVITSDYNKISKLAVHRFFSSPYPWVRQIPRVFLFDWCTDKTDVLANKVMRSKNEKKKKKKSKKKVAAAVQVGQKSPKPLYPVDVEQKYHEEAEGEQGKTTLTVPEPDQHKQVSLANVDGQSATPWLLGDVNPDYKLAVIDAANPKLWKQSSYIVDEFYKKTMAGLEQQRVKEKSGFHKEKFLHEIFDEIQNALYHQKKQHPTLLYNGGTRYIIFKRKGLEQESNEEATMLEMTEVPNECDGGMDETKREETRTAAEVDGDKEKEAIESDGNTLKVEDAKMNKMKSETLDTVTEQELDEMLSDLDEIEDAPDTV